MKKPVKSGIALLLRKKIKKKAFRRNRKLRACLHNLMQAEKGSLGQFETSPVKSNGGFKKILTNASS